MATVQTDDYEVMFEAEDLLTLIIVYQEGSFRSAAERLNKSPSSITYSIKKIEDRMKLKLFDRDSYKAKPSEACKLIYQRIKHIVNLNDDLVRYSKVLAAGAEESLSLLISPLFDINIIEAISNEFKQEYPNTNLNIVVAGQEREFSTDFNLGIIKQHDDDFELEFQSFQEFELVGVANKAHTAHQEDLALAEIERSTEITLNAGGLSSWQVADLASQKELILKGLGWGYLPKSLIEEELASGDLQIIKVLPSKGFHLSLVKRHSIYHGPACQFLWKTILKNKPC